MIPLLDLLEALLLVPLGAVLLIGVALDYHDRRNKL